MKRTTLIKLLETSGENTKKIVLDFFKNTDVKGYQELIRDLQEAINLKIANEKESTIVFYFCNKTILVRDNKQV